MQGNPKEALDILEQVKKFDPENCEAWLMLGRIFILLKDMRKARSAFDHVLESIDRYDAYALVASGNLNIWFARHIDVKEADGEKARRDKLRAALTFFERALRNKLFNAYAAAGIGLVFAEQGDLIGARDVFTQVCFSCCFS